MKSFRAFLSAAALAASTLASTQAFAQVPMDPSKMDMAAPADMTEGEVRRIDTGAGKVTIKHGEIKNLDMPPMTMVFTMAEPAMLSNLKVGDKVRFEDSADGGVELLPEKPAWTLSSLMAGYEGPRPECIDPGASYGREVW